MQSKAKLTIDSQAFAQRNGKRGAWVGADGTRSSKHKTWPFVEMV
jgi:hypothetical protein